MKTKLMLLAALAATASFSVPAHAAIPSCLRPNWTEPYRLAVAGPDTVRANFAVANDCAQPYGIELVLETKVCPFLAYCSWGDFSVDDHQVAAASSDGWAIDGECREGTNRYRLHFYITDGSGVSAEGYSTEPELTCDNDTPPAPSCPDKMPANGCAYWLKPF